MRQISGLDTNVNFLIDLASHPSFQSADVHTGFIDQHFDSLFPPLDVSEKCLAQAVAALILNESNAVQLNAVGQGKNNPFGAGDSFRLNSTAIRTIRLKLRGSEHRVQLKQHDTNYHVKINDSEWQPFEVYPVKEPQSNRFTLKLNLSGVQSTFSAVISSEWIDVFNEVRSKKFYRYFLKISHFSVFLH